MALPVELARTAQKVFQDDYFTDFIPQNSPGIEGGNVIQLVQSLGMKNANFDGQGLTWLINQNERANVVYANTSTYAVPGGDIGFDGTTLKATFDELKIRATIDGPTFRDGGNQGVREQTKAFFNQVENVLMSITNVYNRAMARMILTDGSGNMATLTNANTVTVAAGATGTLTVDSINALQVGGRYDSIDSDGSTVAGTDVVITNIGASHGAGSITVKNESGSSITFGVASTLRLPNAVSANRFHGFDYIISDGTESNFVNYPRVISGGSNVTLNRSTSPYAVNTLRSIVKDAGGALLSYSMLEDIKLALLQRGRRADVGARTDAARILETYPLFCTVDKLVSLEEESRSMQEGFSSTVTQVDNEPPATVYGTFRFHHTELCPADKIYAPNTKTFVSRFDPITDLSYGQFGPWDRIPGYDKYETIKSQRFQMLGLDVRNSFKLKNLGAKVAS